MNAPNRYELYVLEEGEKPVEVSEDTKIPNAATIKIVKQDHTLANLVRSQLLNMPQVTFAGYKVALEQACTKLIGTMVTLENKFKREFTFRDVEGAVPEDPYGTGATAGTTWPGGRDYLDF
ncbi:RPB11/RPC19 RNA polymerase subunit family protein [Abortiporus biennis]